MDHGIGERTVDVKLNLSTPSYLAVSGAGKTITFPEGSEEIKASERWTDLTCEDMEENNTAYIYGWGGYDFCQNGQYGTDRMDCIEKSLKAIEQSIKTAINGLYDQVIWEESLLFFSDGLGCITVD